MGMGPGSGFSGLAGGLQQGLDWDQNRKLKNAQIAQQEAYANDAMRRNYQSQSNAQASPGAAQFGNIPQIQDPVVTGLKNIVGRFRNVMGNRSGVPSGGPASQATVPGQSNVAASPPQATTAGEPTAQAQQPPQSTDQSWRSDQYGTPQGGSYAEGGGIGKPHGMFPPTGIKPRNRARNTEPAGGGIGVPMYADGDQVQPAIPPRGASGLEGAPAAPPASAASAAPQASKAAGKDVVRENVTSNAKAKSQEAGAALLKSVGPQPTRPDSVLGQDLSARMQQGTPQAAAPAQTPPAPTQATPGQGRSPELTAAASAIPGNQPPAPAPAAAPAAVPAAPAIPPRGAPAAAPSGGPPIDFSKVDVDHQEIPNVSAQNWDELKKRAVWQMVGSGMDPVHAAVSVDDSVSDYQHRQFMQMMQQGIALDRAGNKKGAMAALRTAYQYMPTGHDVTFGLDKNTGSIVGFGVDEQTGKPVGSPVMLDQRGLNGLLATYSDPTNFRKEAADWQEQQIHRQTFYQIAVPGAEAQRNLANQRAGYFQGRNQTSEDVAAMRLAGSQARQNLGRIAPNLQNNLERSIQDPNDAGEALYAAGELIQRHGADPATQQQIFGMIQKMYSYPEGPQREAFARANNIPRLRSSPGGGQMYDAMYGGEADTGQQYGIPPR